MIRRPPRSTHCISSAASDVYKRQYLNRLSDTIRTLQSTPGRLTQTAEIASFDAWIKQYRPDENTINSVISYYTKGSVLGFLLDAQVRAATNGANHGPRSTPATSLAVSRNCCGVKPRAPE